MTSQLHGLFEVIDREVGMSFKPYLQFAKKGKSLIHLVLGFNAVVGLGALGSVLYESKRDRNPNEGMPFSGPHYHSADGEVLSKLPVLNEGIISPTMRWCTSLSLQGLHLTVPRWPIIVNASVDDPPSRVMYRPVSGSGYWVHEPRYRLDSSLPSPNFVR
jgi:hypothetical protein